MVAPAETGELAEAFIADALARQGIDRQQLTRHADRGTSMTSKQVAQLLVDLGVGSGCAAELDPSLRVVVAEEVFEADLPLTKDALQEACLRYDEMGRRTARERLHGGFR